MNILEKTVQEIIADGVVDAKEVVDLTEIIYADGSVDKEEADAMFLINDAVSGNDNDPTYKDLFVKSISDFVLEDEETPGVIDELEGDYLVSKIEGDGQIDEIEKALLANLKEKATSIESESLNKLISENL